MKRPHQRVRERVAGPVGSPAPGPVVPQGRLQTAVTELGLHVANRRSGVKHERGAGVAQAVRGDNRDTSLGAQPRRALRDD